MDTAVFKEFYEEFYRILDACADSAYQALFSAYEKEPGVEATFPSELVRRRRPAATKKTQLYCDCRLPEDGEEPMAYCECCRRWFHRSCQKIPDVIFYPGHKQGWFCSHCL